MVGLDTVCSFFISCPVLMLLFVLQAPVCMSCGRLACTATTTLTGWWTWWHGEGEGGREKGGKRGSWEERGDSNPSMMLHHTCFLNAIG